MKVAAARGALVGLTWAIVLGTGALAGAGVVCAEPVVPPPAPGAAGPRGAPVAAAVSSARTIDRLAPARVKATYSGQLWVYGRGFKGGDRVTLGDHELPTEWVSSSTVVATLTADHRGAYAIAVGRANARSAPVTLVVEPSPPRFAPLALQVVDEEQRLEIEVSPIEGEPGRHSRVLAEQLPPGALWDERTRRLLFEPDLIQGGQTYRARFRAVDGVVSATVSVDVEVVDTIRLPEPRVVMVTHRPGWTRVVLNQHTDARTSGGKWAGKSYEARICVPLAASRDTRMPVRIFLHGAEAEMPDGCVDDEIRIYPADPDTTYWWGYGTTNYTQRRILQLLEWVLDTFPGADPTRAYLVGTSMGGAGVLNLGLMYARHFATAEADWPQSVPRRQRPGRMRSLHDLWGKPPPLDEDGVRTDNVWDLQDVTRVLVEERAARDQYLYVRHGKDDPVIHFGAAVMPSPLTGLSLYGALELARVGHYVVWDEAGHGTPDPVMGKRWWDAGWRRLEDPITFLRTDLAFPAFTGSSANEDPGDGPRTPGAPLDPTKGYSGRVGTPGDTGWNGALAGMFNRWLRWDARRIVDELDRLEMPLFLHTGTGSPPPRPGYPSVGDLRLSEESIRASVTPRRVQRFRCLPGERVVWTFGDRSGEVVADADGTVTVPDLAITSAPEVLVLERVEAEMGR